MTSQRRRFYIAVLEHMRESPIIPTAKQIAVWLGTSEWTDPPFELVDIMKRLYAWAPDKPYPPLPSQEDFSRAQGGRFDRRWWMPGAAPAAPPPVHRAVDLTLFGDGER